MASYFSEDLLNSRYQSTKVHIVSQWLNMGAQRGEYYLQCPCYQDCYCTDWEEMPRIPLNFCMYPGEMDMFVVHQSFEQYGLIVRWHCIECERELSCGFPPLGTL